MSTTLSGLGANPLSRVTIGALADLGYTVNYARAESYTLGQALQGLMAEGADGVTIRDVVGQAKFTVDAFGRLVSYKP